MQRALTYSGPVANGGGGQPVAVSAAQVYIRPESTASQHHTIPSRQLPSADAIQAQAMSEPRHSRATGRTALDDLTEFADPPPDYVLSEFRALNEELERQPSGADSENAPDDLRLRVSRLEHDVRHLERAVQQSVPRQLHSELAELSSHYSALEELWMKAMPGVTSDETRRFRLPGVDSESPPSPPRYDEIPCSVEGGQQDLSFSDESLPQEPLARLGVFKERYLQATSTFGEYTRERLTVRALRELVPQVADVAWDWGAVEKTLDKVSQFLESFQRHHPLWSDPHFAE